VARRVNFDPLTGRRLLPFERVSVAGIGSDASVSLTLLPAVCDAGRTNEFTFRIRHDL